MEPNSTPYLPPPLLSLSSSYSPFFFLFSPLLTFLFLKLCTTYLPLLLIAYIHVYVNAYIPSLIRLPISPLLLFPSSSLDSPSLPHPFSPSAFPRLLPCLTLFFPPDLSCLHTLRPFSTKKKRCNSCNHYPLFELMKVMT